MSSLDAGSLVRGQPLQFSEDLPKINYGRLISARPRLRQRDRTGASMRHQLAYADQGDHAEPAPPRARPPRPAARPAPKKADYTFAHAGRQVRIGPVAFWIVVGTLVIMATWSIATATYFAFREDVLTRLIARQAEMQFAYEDRIAEMRAQVDRITSRQLLDQEQYEQKIEQLLRRQAALESRASALGAIADPTPTGSIKSPARTPTIESPPAGKPSPINDKMIFVPPPDREARLESRIRADDATRLAVRADAAGMEGVLARLQASLDRIEARQSNALNTLEDNYDSRARRMRNVLTDLGIQLPKALAPASTATGGPFVPFKPKADGGVFDRQLYRIALARYQVDRLTRTMAMVPVRKPVLGEIDTTSGFGMRIDPFIRSPAMHTGLDFRGQQGDSIRATAGGTVTQAGWSGGYGKMVEIDHGNGLSTRYGHLSHIAVAVGQSVRSGQTVGRLGSTGRSTGPHLHYETRVDGEAVDPQKFLRAGIRLGEKL
jgi:murein DD-endopeptidase MepM/ murein hydrolase activator NlpD